MVCDIVRLWYCFLLVLLVILSEHFQEKKLDKCPVACESVEFSAQLSYARYPANTYADKLLSKQRNMTGTIQENRQYLRYCKVLLCWQIVCIQFRSLACKIKGIYIFFILPSVEVETYQQLISSGSMRTFLKMYNNMCDEKPCKTNARKYVKW